MKLFKIVYRRFYPGKSDNSYYVHKDGTSIVLKITRTYNVIIFDYGIVLSDVKVAPTC